jgi:phosphatidylserine/phosphatidylglycerophosphate/cardiolipin synthase-like enzyme
MFVHNSNAAGFSVKAWIGDAKTLLAFNFASATDATNLAGFTIRIQPHGQPAYYQFNSLVLPPGNHAAIAGEPPNSSANAPIQKFRWLHVPGSFHQGEDPFYGIYTYTVTPRYFSNKLLTTLDPTKSLSLDVMVQPYATPQVELGFTRGFVQSQAFAHHFGTTALFEPKAKDLLFDTNAQAGRNDQGQTFTFLQEYEWSGFTARTRIMGILQTVISDATISIDVFAYDLNEPDVCRAFLQLAGEGRMRIILDNASLHTKAGAPEIAFDQAFQKAKKAPADIKRGKFGRFAHDKVIIVYKGTDPATRTAQKILSGSTNFSVTGMYVNSNHVIVFDNTDVAALYAKVFDEAWTDGVSESFNTSSLAGQEFVFNQKGLPDMAITFSPHSKDFVTANLAEMAKRIASSTTSVLFAVMDITSGGGELKALQNLHGQQHIFSYGITDNPGKSIELYRPGVKDGIIVSGKPGTTMLPPPFDVEKNIGLGHQIHHKFIVCDFSTPNAIVWCGSSNLAQGGEQENGDNLIHIKDTDIATVFAIEALALVDHFDFRDSHGPGAANSKTAPKAPLGAGKTAAQHDAAKPAAGAPAPLTLYVNDTWATRYFDPNDLHYEDRELFG